MKYLPQILLILRFSFLGELLHSFIPAPIPASIYGMVLMFLALSLKIVKVPQVRDAGNFLTTFLPVLFVAPIVSLMDCWDVIRPNLLAIAVILLVSTGLCFVITGLSTQFLTGKQKEGTEK